MKKQAADEECAKQGYPCDCCHVFYRCYGEIVDRVLELEKKMAKLGGE